MLLQTSEVATAEKEETNSADAINVLIFITHLIYSYLVSMT
ncbi:hypothetical protein INT55_0020 [Salmonella phage INT55]|nr:hypothetical protein INT55_0020 [Salmonella phage INT55]WAQ79728.1 hypothetical protein INT59_0019 [Salmonella phage INT59]